jgi:hypothetical protein
VGEIVRLPTQQPADDTDVGLDRLDTHHNLRLRPLEPPDLRPEMQLVGERKVRLPALPDEMIDVVAEAAFDDQIPYRPHEPTAFGHVQGIFIGPNEGAGSGRARHGTARSRLPAGAVRPWRKK